MVHLTLSVMSIPKDNLYVIDKNKQTGNYINCWDSLLTQSLEKCNKESKGTVIFLGESGIGKRSLIQCLSKIQLNEKAYNNNEYSNVTEYKKDNISSPEVKQTNIAKLGYTYFQTFPLDEDRNQIEFKKETKVWIIEEEYDSKGITIFNKALDYAIPDLETLTHSVAIVTVNLSNPCNALDSLNFWKEKLKLHVMSLIKDTEKPSYDPYLVVQKYIQECYRTFDNLDIDMTEEDGTFMIPKGVLLHNIGIPILVVGTKADLITDASTDETTQMRLEFLQKHLRSFCIEHGASLTYTSSYTNINIQLFFHYLFHRLYPNIHTFYHNDKQITKNNKDENSPISATLGQKIITIRDSVHVPAGYDFVELIEILALKLSNNLSFSDVFPKSFSEKKVDKSLDKPTIFEETWTDHQTFLANLLVLQKALPNSVRTQTTNAAYEALHTFNQAVQTIDQDIANYHDNLKDITHSYHQITAEEAKENPTLITQFFQNLLDRDQ